jgi:hypothetical protein
MSPYYAPPPQYQQGNQYTRVSLKVYRGNQISYTNFLLNPGLIPAGTPCRVLGTSVRSFLLEINGMRYYLVPEQRNAWNVAMTPTILDKYVSSAPPARPPNYDAYMGRLSSVPGGLTREEVITVFGYPAWVGASANTANMSRAQILASDNWIYYLNAWRVKLRIEFRGGRSLPAKLGR